MVLRTGCRSGERRLYALGVCQFQGSIDLIGRYVVEALAFVLLGQRFPIEFGSLQQRECSHNVGTCKGERVFYGAVHMTLGSKVDDTVHLLLLHQLIEGVEVADVHLHKLVVGLILDVLQIGKVAGIGQLVEVDDVILGILVHKQAHHVASYKACATGNDNSSFHIYIYLFIFLM